MPRIRVLPDDLVNRIAAGEVVERPAAVVKELVENSLDAGAGRVEVELSQGGRSLVRVDDDGCGMEPDDVLLALERHATSKISAAGDLERIATLGFRGEAIPSIAAVSRFRLTSCADPAQGGARVVVEGGQIVAVEAAARARGTSVEVRDLFFNLPARRKFLHTAETELRHAQESLWVAAMARPEVGFALRHGSRVLLEVGAVADEAARLRDLMRPRVSAVRRFAAAGPGVRAWGLLAEGGGAGRPVLHLLVNRRPVRDRLLVAAVQRGLRRGGTAGAGLRVAVFVEVEPGAVDVNVHPAKAEVRFARAGAVFAVVERAVADGVGAGQGTVAVGGVATWSRGVAETATSDRTAYDRSPAGVSTRRLFEHPVFDGAEGTRPATGTFRTGPRAGGGHPRSGPPDTPLGRLIGQYRGSFLLVEDEHGLVIVDQHVAHERVLYERVRRRLGGEPPPSQRLLEPILVEVDDALAGTLPRVAGLLSAVGLEVERFGPTTLRVEAVPVEVDGEAAAELVVEVLERATSLDLDPNGVLEALAHEIAAGLSCRAAVKVNHILTVEEQRALISDLMATERPYRCPHGRPIVLRLSQEEMERRLGRR